MKKVYLVYKLSEYVSDQRLKGGFYHFEEMRVEE